MNANHPLHFGTKANNRNRKQLSILVIVGLQIAAPAFAFNVGPYKLGMPNAAAKKFGFSECEQDPSTAKFIRCSIQDGLDRYIPGVKSATVHFDKQARTIQEINVTLSKVPFQTAMEQLQIAKCTEHIKGESYKGWCYSMPNKTRLISTEGPCQLRWCDKTTDLIHIRLKVDAKHVNGYLQTKRAIAKEHSDVNRIESGR